MKKILLVAIDFWPKIGGVANYYAHLCRGIESDKIVVLTAKTQQTQKHKNTENTEWQKFDFSVFRRNLLWKFIWPHWLPLIWQIWQVARKEKVEIIWVGEILPSGTAVYLLTRIFKRPFIVFCHGMDILQAAKSRRKRWLAKKIFDKAEGVTVNSHYTKGLAERFGVPTNKIKIIYPRIDASGVNDITPADCQALRESYDLAGKKILFSISRLTKRKGFDMVIESLNRVWEQLPNLVYVIAGQGEDKQRLEKLASEADESGRRIIFLGQVSEHDKWLWLKTCAAFIMLPREEPDDVEGFGIVFLEAMAAVKPIIASTSGGAGEALNGYEYCHFVDPLDVRDITNKILKLFEK